MRSPLEFLYASTPAEFRSAYGLSESVERLQAATRRSTFWTVTEQAAMGAVSESSVCLQRAIPMVRNAFKPFFIGHFEMRDEGVYLTGSFTLLGFVKGFMTLWLGMMLAMGIALVGALLSRQGSSWPVMLVLLGLCCFAIALARFGRWLARNDIEWLSSVIRSALDERAAGQRPSRA